MQLTSSIEHTGFGLIGFKIEEGIGQGLSHSINMNVGGLKFKGTNYVFVILELCQRNKKQQQKK